MAAQTSSYQMIPRPIFRGRVKQLVEHCRRFKVTAANQESAGAALQLQMVLPEPPSLQNSILGLARDSPPPGLFQGPARESEFLAV
jgi:hypothetical protein